jgi:hypothetical protein
VQIDPRVSSAAQELIARGRREAPEQDTDRWGAGYEAGYAAGMAEMKPEQEPVAWQYKKDGGGVFVSDQCLADVEVWNDIEWSKPLYTHPPRREWRGLTDVEWMNIVNKNHAWFGMRPDEVAHEVCKLTEAKLKELNT